MEVGEIWVNFIQVTLHIKKNTREKSVWGAICEPCGKKDKSSGNVLNCCEGWESRVSGELAYLLPFPTLAEKQLQQSRCPRFCGFLSHIKSIHRAASVRSGWNAFQLHLHHDKAHQEQR